MDSLMMPQILLLNPWALVLLLPTVSWLVWSSLKWRGLPVIQLRHAFVDRFFQREITACVARWQRWVMVLATTLMIVALAEPVWERASAQQLVALSQADGMIVMETSVTLLLQETQGVSRLAQAQAVVGQIMAERDDQSRSGLIVYADDAYAVLPLTQDKNILRSTVMRLDAAMAGREDTALVESIQLAGWQLADSGKHEGSWIVLVTDGLHSVARGQLDTVMRWLARHQIRLSVVLVGGEAPAENVSNSLIYEPRQLGLLTALADYDVDVVKGEDLPAMKRLIASLTQSVSNSVQVHTSDVKEVMSLTPWCLMLSMLLWVSLWWREVIYFER